MRSVLHVVHSLDPGGAERLVIEMIRAMKGRMESSVACLDRAGDWAGEARSLGAKVETIGRKPGFHPSLGLQIAAIAKDRHADVLHCHQYSPFVYGSLARVVHPRLRVVFTEHGRLANSRVSWKRKLSNRILRRVPVRTVAVCDDLKQHLIHEGFANAHIDVVYNGIRLGPRPSPAHRAEVRSSWGVHPQAFVIGTVARLDEVKDIPTLLQAHASLLEKFPSIQLWILGDGPERESLERSAREGVRAGSVRFFGHRQDARNLLPALDVYVNSSTYEGVSLSIVEAMAAGRPIVATRTGGNPEVVSDAVTGILVPARDANALAASIESLVRDRDQAERLGAAGRKRAEEMFDFDRMIEYYLRAYAD
jgi:glycosyltransferase involved in cell wall biosynthesis